MKNIITLIAVLFISAPVFAQIEVAKEKKEDKIIGEAYLPNGSATMKMLGEKIGDKDYVWLGFQNQEYQSISDIKSVMFAATEEDLDGLFDILKEIIKTDKEQEIKLGTNYILNASKFSDSSIFMYFFKGSRKNGYFTLSPSGLHQLFGKEFDKKEWKQYLKS